MDGYFRIAQTQLNRLSACPRRFQHTDLEQLAVPSDPDQQERQLWGTRFHLLMQQWQLGLPVEPIVQDDRLLQQWFQTFVDAAPTILGPPDGAVRQSEHLRTLAFQGYLLTVVYDLLLTRGDRAQILDWKTYPRPQNPRWLLQNWQTRLYPFVLAETTDYAPEQISMTYWFFQSHGPNAETPEPQHVTLHYDTRQHEQTRQDLSHLLGQLTRWLDRYQLGEPFPQLGIAANQCERCSVAARCVEADADDRASDSILTLADIQEVPL